MFLYLQKIFALWKLPDILLCKFDIHVVKSVFALSFQIFLSGSMTY